MIAAHGHEIGVFAAVLQARVMAVIDAEGDEHIQPGLVPVLDDDRDGISPLLHELVCVFIDAPFGGRLELVAVRAPEGADFRAVQVPVAQAVRVRAHPGVHADLPVQRVHHRIAQRINGLAHEPLDADGGLHIRCAERAAVIAQHEAALFFGGLGWRSAVRSESLRHGEQHEEDLGD